MWSQVLFPPIHKDIGENAVLPLDAVGEFP